MRSVPWRRLRAVVISLFLLSTVLAEPASAAARVEGQAVADRPTASPAVPTAVAKFLPRGARIYADPAEAAVAPLATTSDSYSYWFTSSWSSGQTQYVSDYTTWTFYKINGSSSHFFVKVQGTAQTKWPYILKKYEPWLMRASGTSTLGNWDPDRQVTVNDGQQISLSVSYGTVTLGLTFTATSQTYNPYARADMYSVEWRGAKSGYAVEIGRAHV